MRSYIVIPARHASTRLPQKMLLRSTGKSLLEHTYEVARAARLPSGVIVATDHEEIVREVRQFGGQVMLTCPDCASGTDRVAEVARIRTDADVFVNLQGDEPEMEPAAIDRVVELLASDPTASMATLATPLRSAERLADPSCVKVVCDDGGRALYFSRSPIPFVRDASGTELTDDPPLYLQHLGLYAYRRDFLLQLAAAPPSRLEQAEKLEQLRALGLGERIQVGVVPHAWPGIDTPADYEQFVTRYRLAS